MLTAIPKTVYPPLEDSQLLAGVVKKLAHGRVLDMGCGNGAQTRAALSITHASKPRVTSVLGLDINPAAIEYCELTIKDKRATFCVSDLFATLTSSSSKQYLVFDTIIFNPPYLPADNYSHGALKDAATIGGKFGWETIAHFLDQAPEFLDDNGTILLLFTSRTDKRAVDDIIAKRMLASALLAEKTIRDETDDEIYYVYAITKSAARIDAEKRGVRQITFLEQGKRGQVYVGTLRKKKVCLKVPRPDTAATGIVLREAGMLKRVNKKRIGPKLIFVDENVMCMEFIDGKRIEEWLEGASKQQTIRMFKELLRQCRVLDVMGVQKDEMGYPYKHVIVKEKNVKLPTPVLIDFERARMTEHAHNVTQLCQYLARLANELKTKGIVISTAALRVAAKEYHVAPTEKFFSRILGLVR